MGLKGNLRELPLSDLIEMTTLGSKSGVLEISDEQGVSVGRLVFREGRLVGASCGALGPEKAFYTLLGLKEGRFDFDTEAAIGDDHCNLPTSSLLIEGMRRIDELVELRRAMPAPARVRYLGGQARETVEARVLGYVGPGGRTVGDVVDGVLVGADADEYDALKAIARLEARGVVRLEIPRGADGQELAPSAPPQPELER